MSGEVVLVAPVPDLAASPSSGRHHVLLRHSGIFAAGVDESLAGADCNPLPGDSGSDQGFGVGGRTAEKIVADTKGPSPRVRAKARTWRSASVASRRIAENSASPNAVRARTGSMSSGATTTNLSAPAAANVSCRTTPFRSPTGAPRFQVNDSWAMSMKAVRRSSRQASAAMSQPTVDAPTHRGPVIQRTRRLPRSPADASGGGPLPTGPAVWLGSRSRESSSRTPHRLSGRG